LQSELPVEKKMLPPAVAGPEPDIHTELRKKSLCEVACVSFNSACASGAKFEARHPSTQPRDTFAS
jgi:hypothetical protein